jgi:hypothetical protein
VVRFRAGRSQLAARLERGNHAAATTLRRADQTIMAAEPKSEADLIRALAEDLALEILASYTPEDFADADFTSLGEAAVYLAQHDPGPGPVLEELIAKVQKAAGT